jgi:methylase of polypeptide subunit release factors
MTIEELRARLSDFRERAEGSTAAEERIVAAMESGEMRDDVADSQRFDLWEADAENFHELLGLVEQFIREQTAP